MNPDPPQPATRHSGGGIQPMPNPYGSRTPDPPQPAPDWRTATRAALGEEIERLREERDAYGDTLAKIAESGAADPPTWNLSAAIVAKMVLDQRGYLPFGRQKNAEAEIERLDARVADLEAQRAAVTGDPT